MKDTGKMNENQLMAGYVATRNEKYFSALVSLYGKKLFNYIVRRIGNSENAGDVYQTVWMKVALNADRYKNKNKFSNYLFFIATNACFDHLRKLKKDNDNIFREIVTEDGETRDPVENLSSYEPDPEESGLLKERGELLQEAVNGLPDEQKDVILMRSSGLTFREISEIKEVSVNSILSRNRYGIEKLKKKLVTEGNNGL